MQSLASELGVGGGGDINELVDDIRYRVLESEEKRQAAEKRARAIEQKHLDSAMKVQVLEMELAEARRQRDAALKDLQVNTFIFTLFLKFARTVCQLCQLNINYYLQ